MRPDYRIRILQLLYEGKNKTAYYYVQLLDKYFYKK
jgi:hypothetical protein